MTEQSEWRFTLPQRQLPPRIHLPPRRYETNTLVYERYNKCIHVRSILVLLVLGDEILHVRLSLSELDNT